MKFKTNPEIFQRINNINSEFYKDISISEELLLFEGFRRMYEVNVKINNMLQEEIYTLATINRLIPDDIKEKISDIIFENDRARSSEGKSIMAGTGVFGHSMAHMYLTWEMFSENDFVKELHPMNPYHFFVRMFERGIRIDKEHKFYNLLVTFFSSYSLAKLQSKEIYQETPYLVSTDDEYLDKINAVYAEYKVLPTWLEKDNKRGYVI
ncbi:MULTISPECIES: hypothetical protein [unclassified Arcicella]|uniref:hypothetical protein n=1 Tax=unclassified Arcicella TaxID=2644986 RepID=UPI00285DFB5A|nr:MULTISPECIES: hypothetical protein [unclassified Arcicella]MDR6564646.1 hypothetical protein [Arcicella sp. BE51]MDR6814426.1 hypothetical protein [Arcicella sp. BE140]MDR6825818.1 hypothetical protein [Arcicella sp. BE139]